MFSSDAHPGRVTVGRESERGGWNGAGKSSALAAKEEVVVACFRKGKGKGVKWIRLDETKLVARGLGRQRSGKGDRQTAGHSWT
uniref:Uncharacterized protein n=1 Tax=Oryza sativa subsp. japonica TaxID=39947 RepID=Q84QP2_ORYSJ|nr:hypothetical protein [Oryza sativa Japonica Group]BAD03035.1 hypothetical protein [Oryza sativa Japonica Group]